jgi:basic membrane lipoprotein Med (substrate-binding protein (PBP1-ABC) superfamily)
MRAFSLIAVAALLVLPGCETDVSKKADTSPNPALSDVANASESDSASSTESTYTAARSESELNAESTSESSESPSAKSVLAKALSAAKTDNKNLLVHFGSPG